MCCHFAGSDDPRMLQRHSDSSAIPDLSALHRALDRGPLIIPNAVQQQQQLVPRQLHHRRSSAETLVAKVSSYCVYLDWYKINILLDLNDLCWHAQDLNM